MKALMGSKLVGWGLVAAAIFVIGSAASGPPKGKNTEVSQKTAKSNVLGESEKTASSRGGGMESASKTQPGNKVPILRYQSINNKKFNQQMDYLKENNYKVISLSKLVSLISSQKILPKKSLVIVFEGAKNNFYSEAYPLLLKYGYDATFFVTTNRPGTYGYMSWGNLKEISKAGYLIGSSSVSFPDLVSISKSRMEEEIKISQIDIEGELGIQAKYFLYPRGSYSAEIISMLKKYGFKSALTYRNKKVSLEADVFQLPTINIDKGITLTTFSGFLK